MGSFDDLPGRGNNHAIEEKAEAAFQALISESEHFILQRADRKDYGTDCQLEVLEQGHPTNVRLHVQLKGSEQALNPDGSFSLSVERTNINYLVAGEYSHFVLYHLPTKTLRFASVEGVLQYYAHKRRNWLDQETLTVRFAESLTHERLETLADLALANARASRDRRLEQLQAMPAGLPDLLHDAAPTIHVPDDPADARARLEQLYNYNADMAISAAFGQFAAILGQDSDAVGFCYMAEINLGMANRSRFRERIEPSIAYFERRLSEGKYVPGSLHYTIGNALSALGDEAAAKARYQAAASDMIFMSEPTSAAQVLKNLGTSIDRLGDEDMAAELYRGALVMNPLLPEAHLALGMYLHRKGEFAGALSHYDQIVFTNRQLSENASVIGWRLNALFNLGETREAIQAINLLLADADREPWIWPWCARQFAMFGRTSVTAARGALAFWKRCINAKPEFSVARAELLLAQFYLRDQGVDIGMDYAAFRPVFDTQITHIEGERAALAWDRLGHWAQDKNDWPEAERGFRHAYNIGGGHYGYCLGTSLNFLGRYEDALPLVLAQAEGIQPDAMSWFQVGVANAHLGRPADAVAAYRKGLVLDPDYPEAMFNMAGTLWNSGDREQAEIVFRTAAFQFPDHELTARLRHDLPHLL